MNDTSPSPRDLPVQAVARARFAWLALDRENPRLCMIGGESDDTDIIAELYRSENLGGLLQSIAANGYLDIEPLIVMPSNGNLVVLEGNRRLAAVQLFRRSDLAGRIADRHNVRIEVPGMSDRNRISLEHVSVYRIESRNEARSFMGFKHTNGAARWSSYVTAKFAAQWHREGGQSLSDIARRMGDRHDAVKRMVNAMYVLEQAEEAEIFDVSDRMTPRFNFSHLCAALSRAPYMKFLGLTATWSRDYPEPNPVPTDRLDRLGKILLWLYGSRRNDVEPAIRAQDPDIRRLGEVLDSEEGSMALTTKGRLADAHASIQPPDRKFRESLIRARAELREANYNLRGFDGGARSLLGIAEDVSESSRSIVDRMKRKIREAAVDP